MKRLIIFLFLCFYGVVAMSQTPAWVNPSQRSSMFPSGSFLMAFKSESCDEEDSEQVLKKIVKLAKSDLVEQIRVTVKSSSTVRLENENSASDEYFRQDGSVNAEASLTGLTTDTYYDRKKQEAYAIAYLDIAGLISSCKAEIADYAAKVESKLRLGDEMAQKDDLEAAMRAYGDCYALISRMEKNAALLATVGKENDGSGIPELELRVRKGMSQLKQLRPLTLDEASLFIAEDLRQQIRTRDVDGFLFLGGFTYADTRQMAPLSSRLKVSLEQKMTSLNFNIKDEATAREELKEEGTNVFMLSGTFWEEGGEIKILTHIRRVIDGKNMAASEARISREWLEKNNISWLP